MGICATKLFACTGSQLPAAMLAVLTLVMHRMQTETAGCVPVLCVVTNVDPLGRRTQWRL